MGRHDKVTADPALSFSHPAGTKVAVMQPLVHERLGALGYIWPRHWVGHLRRADAAYDRLVELHDRLEDVPLGNDTDASCRPTTSCSTSTAPARTWW